MKAFLYLITYNDLLPYVAGVSVLIFVLVFLTSYLFTSKKNKDSVDTLVSSFNMGAVPAIAFFMLISIVTELFIKEPCNALIARTYHMFHAHVANLCVDQEDRSNCPKNEGELKAFNPTAYQSLQACTDTQYEYSPTGSYRWVVRFNKDLVLASSSELSSSYNSYSLSEAKELGLWK